VAGKRAEAKDAQHSIIWLVPLLLLLLLLLR
jgi:hypothetical protein